VIEDFSAVAGNKFVAKQMVKVLDGMGLFFPVK
jgi:hypothetical protein